MDQAFPYGVLQDVALQRINLRLIQQNWDDLIRVAGSLKMGPVSAPALMRTLHFGS